MANPFTAHPTAVGETYLQHLRFALRFGVRMLTGRRGRHYPFGVPVPVRHDGEPHQRRARGDARRVARPQRASRGHRNDATPRLPHLTPMPYRRLAETDVRGKRVFIRSDLNVPQDDAGNITDDSRIRASVPGIRDALARGAAVMVTSHLGRPTEGRWSEADSLAPIARRLSELLGAPVPLVRDWVDGGAWHAGLKPGDVRAARELPLQRRREEGRRCARAKDGGALRRLRQRCVRHRAPRRSDDARNRQVRSHRLRRSAPRSGARRTRPRARQSGAPARRDRRRIEGLDQANGTESPRRQSRRADRGRRHRQHVRPGGSRPCGQVAGRD